MLGRVIVLSLLFALGGLWSVWSGTTPATIGPFGILLVFVLMYVSAVSLLTFLFFGLNRLIIRILSASNVGIKTTLERMTLGRSYYFASVIALAPIMVIGMQSVGKVGVYELTLIVIFVVISCTYIAKRTG